MNWSAPTQRSNDEKILNQVLVPSIWKKVKKNLLAKFLTEFLYEEIINPDVIATHKDNSVTFLYRITDELSYQFNAEPRMLTNFQVDVESMVRIFKGESEAAWDVSLFIIDIKERIGIKDITQAYFLREMDNTLLADAHLQAHNRLSSDELLNVSSSELEGEMTAHPWIVVNKGRIGFGYDDYQRFAPEMKNKIQLNWIAINKSSSSFNTTDDLTPRALLVSELGEEKLKQFENILLAKDLNPEKYWFMPVHEWQWQNTLIPQFSQDIALKNIVSVGSSDDYYLPMQSIRTMNNITEDKRHYVKLPVSILNTSVYRGLPGERTVLAPLLTQWAKSKLEADEYLTKKCRFILLGEIASINYDHSIYNNLPSAPYQFREFLGVIWRESLDAKLKENEKGITMSSLLHIDSDGKPFMKSLIESSGLSTKIWLTKLLEKTLPPLLHVLYNYGMVFSPHGENSVLIMENHIPTGLAMKDFVDDINIYDGDLPELNDIPESIRSVLLSHPGEVLCHFIYTGLYVVHYRFMANILASHMEFPEIEFWQLVHKTIEAYQAEFPQLTDRFEIFDMQRESFEKVCLNRVRLLTQGYADDAERPKPEILRAISNPAHPKHCGLSNDQENMNTIPLTKNTSAPNSKIVYSSDIDIGHFEMRLFDLEKDLDLLHRWMNSEHVIQFWQLNKSQDELKTHFEEMLADPHQELVIISLDGEDLVYFEIYSATGDRIEGKYQQQDHDWGYHGLIGEISSIGKGLAIPIAKETMRYIFECKKAQRIISEPDEQAIASEKVDLRLGFEFQHYIDFPEKRAKLFILEKNTFYKLNP
jgi:siderophore synthetase component/RimJ/RimL family protein N-acetyltransferase